MISGKAVEYKLFWVGNEKNLGIGIFLAKKWVFIHISRVRWGGHMPPLRPPPPPPPPTFFQNNDFFMRMKSLSIFLSVNRSTRYSFSIKSLYAHFRH